ncbi:hypothetical protein UKMH10_1814 [Burkholderia pseudomallei]|nr:hypothetical protein UKMH10_1814 [Burkholderia pseudomallei]
MAKRPATRTRCAAARALRRGAAGRTPACVCARDDGVRRASAVRFAGGLRYTWIAKLRRLPPPSSPKRAASGAARLR